MDYTLLCWKLILNKIKASWKTLIFFGDKKFWSPDGPARRAFKSPGRFIGRLGRPGDLLFYTLLDSVLPKLFMAPVRMPILRRFGQVTHTIPV